MKKRVSFLLIVVVGLAFVLAACGEKSQESVIEQLDNKVSSMEGYKAQAEMTMKTGQEEQKYGIDVWHKKKDFYRVALMSSQDEKSNQVILKNEDGVFVLTPALKKSFKFQNEWPENSSQPYLFQSLVNDVKQDPDATFTVTDTHYIFQTKTNYPSNHTLPYQEIHFDKKSYMPHLVKVLDKDKTALVEVTFSNFEFDPELTAEDFSQESNMASESADVLASAESDDNNIEGFEIMYPLQMAGAELIEQKEIGLEDGERIIMTFAGDKNFTLVQERKDVIPAQSLPKEVSGDIVNLGYTIGGLSDNMLEWTYNGVDFYLASEDLTKDELIEVARSIQGRAVK